MELLRITIISVSILLVTGDICTGQDFENRRTAFQKSYSYEEKEDYISSISMIKGVYDENSYEINLRLGWLTYKAGNHTDSKKFYSRAVSLMPYSVESRLGLVYPLSAMGNWSEVITQYEKILEITPNNSVVLYRLGYVYYTKGNFELASKHFEKVVNLYPFDYDGLTMLAWTNLKLNNTREAKILFQKALLNNPTGSSATEGLNLLK
jgi:tetratricopeptide (TPR) repeat protein